MTDPGGSSPDSSDHRIGDAERAAATDALIAHREAGRLDPVEYEERQVQIARARTWVEIEPLFADLPQPYPPGMPVPVALGSRPLGASGPPGQAVGQYPAQHEVAGQGLLGGLIPHEYNATVMALTPFAALLLFIITHAWVWFLAIPVLGILLYGPEGTGERRRLGGPTRQEQWRLDRDQRRADRDRRRGR